MSGHETRIETAELFPRVRRIKYTSILSKALNTLGTKDTHTHQQQFQQSELNAVELHAIATVSDSGLQQSIDDSLFSLPADSGVQE